MGNEKDFLNQDQDTYKYLVDKFGKDKIAQRYDWLYTLLCLLLPLWQEEK